MTTEPVLYAIRPAHPGAHLFHLTVTVAQPDAGGQRFSLPAWIPGSYMVREFARHIVRLSALCGDRRVAVQKVDKHTWQCAPVQGPLTLAYEVYAWDLSVRAAHLDETHGFFNGPCVFLLPEGHREAACRLDIFAPQGKRYDAWRIATGLTPAPTTTPGTFGTYLASNYDELIDCPVEMGSFLQITFMACGIEHHIALTGRVPQLDVERLRTDVAKICEAQIRLFEPRRATAPFASYVFLTMAVGEGYGGLEHRNSTALLCKRDQLPFLGMTDSTEGYRVFLGLVSHEYFHSWNVKRIKPAAFVPYDLSRENYTRLLWLFEGFTAYYDDLMLVRAGLITERQYLDVIGRTATAVLQHTGRLKQSLAESSFDAWIKYYRPDENTPNSAVSYYQKGALVGLALDLSIREQTQGRRSLDDLMRLLWRRCRDAGAAYAGIDEHALAAAIDEVSGAPLSRQLRSWTDTTADPDLATLLKTVGIDFSARAAVDVPHVALLGVRIEGAEARVTHVSEGGPAQAAGVSAADTIVAIDGLRASGGKLDGLLTRYRPGEVIELLAFRRDELMRFNVRLASLPPKRQVLDIADRDSKPTSPTRQRRRRWLGTR